MEVKVKNGFEETLYEIKEKDTASPSTVLQLKTYFHQVFHSCKLNMNALIEIGKAEWNFECFVLTLMALYCITVFIVVLME